MFICIRDDRVYKHTKSQGSTQDLYISDKWIWAIIFRIIKPEHFQKQSYSSQSVARKLVFKLKEERKKGSQFKVIKKSKFPADRRTFAFLAQKSVGPKGMPKRTTQMVTQKAGKELNTGRAVKEDTFSAKTKSKQFFLLKPMTPGKTRKNEV